MFAFFDKQNGFIKKQLASNSSVFSPSDLGGIRLPTGLEELQQLLLRLPLAHRGAQVPLPQQGSLSALKALYFFFFPSLPGPWLGARAPQPLGSLCLGLKRLFLCRVLPSPAELLPSLAAEELRDRAGHVPALSSALGGTWVTSDNLSPSQRCPMDFAVPRCHGTTGILSQYHNPFLKR